MKTYKNVYQELCSWENIYSAFMKAQKGKSKKQDVISFRENIIGNITTLQRELTEGTYKPRPLSTFVIRDPKTRVIRKSAFRDRIVHHAICNIIEPIFERTFIYDSFANRKGKGSSNALKRFDIFKRKTTKNNKTGCFVLKADIRHYFDEVDHDILLHIISRKIKDEQLINLISVVLKNHSDNVGMPLGNMTSQFFANLYLNELDQFVKHNLKARFYIRYVDDFVILHRDKEVLENYKGNISLFLAERLKLHLHETKTKILPLHKGVSFLGFRNYPHHRLLRKANIRGMRKKIGQDDYDSLCKYVEGWSQYARQADTYDLRMSVSESIEQRFPGQTSSLQIGRQMRYAEV
jgi:RNA-directed DNA polymerase